MRVKISPKISVEDDGAGIKFNVFCYNIQPGIKIDYKTGKSSIDDTILSSEEENTGQQSDYIVNIKSKKIHIPDCASVKDIREENRQSYHGYLTNLINGGFKPCKSCNPK